MNKNENTKFGMRQLELDFKDDKNKNRVFLPKPENIINLNRFIKYYESEIDNKNNSISKNHIYSQDEINTNMAKLMLDILEKNQDMEIMINSLKGKMKIIEEDRKVKEEQDKYANEKLNEIINRDNISISNSQIDRQKNLLGEIDDSMFIYLYVISSNLKDILIEKRMSQTELCDKTGINKSTMSYLIANPDKTSLINAYRIAKVLKMNIEEIFDFDVM